MPTSEHGTALAAAPISRLTTKNKYYIISIIITVAVQYCNIQLHSNRLIYRIISQIRSPPSRQRPPIVLMKTTAQVLLSVKALTVTSNLCDVYKILYYAAVYVRGHFCKHVIIRVSYLQSLYSIVVHGYAVHM